MSYDLSAAAGQGAKTTRDCRGDRRQNPEQHRQGKGQEARCPCHAQRFVHEPQPAGMSDEAAEDCRDVGL